MRSEIDTSPQIDGGADSYGNTQYGFNWGPLKVLRAARFEGRAKHPGARVVTVETRFESVNVYVSDGGRSVRVFKDGKELK